MLAGTNSSVPPKPVVGGKFEDDEMGRFSSKEAESVEKRVSPGPWGGSSRGAGMRWRAPKPRTQPRAPSPPQPRAGVMVTGRVTLYSWLYTIKRSGRLRYWHVLD